MLGVISTNTLYELHHVKFLPAVANAHFKKIYGYALLSMHAVSGHNEMQMKSVFKSIVQMSTT